MDEADSGRGSARLKGLFKVALSVAVTWLIFGEASVQQESRPSSLPLQQAVTIAPEKNPLRKAAMSLVLGHYLNPYWYLFTAFVGLNLFQSGFTNWCPMMTFLRRLGVGR